jgi:ABC-type sugar transport system ATPase subunit
MARSIFGVDAYDSGEVLVAGAPLRGSSVRRAVKAGLALVPEDRRHMGLILPMSVAENLVITVLRRLSRFFFRSMRREKDLVKRLVGDLDVRAAGTDVAAETLSGGNQQKLVLGKWMGTSPRMLILDEPTRGVDVGAKAEVHRLIRKLAGDGMATLVISSDLPEILSLCDRIIVMRSGEIAGTLDRSEATQERVLALALPLEEPLEK